LLRGLKRVIDLDAKVAHRALELRMAEQQVRRARVLGSLVDQRRLGLLHRVRAVRFEQLRADIKKGLDSGKVQPWDAQALKRQARARRASKATAQA
jgi:hypothetical protein